MARWTLKQIRAGFAGKRRQAALRKSRSAAQPRPVKKVRSPKMARRRFGRRKRGRGKKSVSILDAGLALNAIGQMVEPFLQRGIVDQLKAGDMNAVQQTLREGAKEAFGVENMIQAGGPYIAAGVGKKIAKAVGARPRPVGGFRAW